MTAEGMSAYATSQRLGRYECLLPLARGGMGEVWAARTRGARGFQKLVAIKTMLPTLLESPECEAMFLDEARIASRIQHPNVTQIFDLGEDDGKLYIAMELVDGDSLAALRRLCEGYRVPLFIALRVMADACAGLHAAHTLKDEQGQSLGVVHRDVSPHNVLLSSTGVVKVTDFGVAKALGQSSKTEVGSVKGKPAYMAPEQALGEPLDCRADVFAAAIVLYELTTGHHPFRGNTPLDTTTQLLTGTFPSPSSHEPNYPPEVEAVVLRALDRDPDGRYQSAEEFGQALLDVAKQTVGVASSQDLAAFVRKCIGSILDSRSELLRQMLVCPERSESSSVAFVSATDVTKACAPTEDDVEIARRSGFMGRLLGRKRSMAVAGGVVLTLSLLGIVAVSSVGKSSAAAVKPATISQGMPLNPMPVLSEESMSPTRTAAALRVSELATSETKVPEPPDAGPSPRSTSVSIARKATQSAKRVPRRMAPKLARVPVQSPGF